VSVCEQ
jgi:hypothetical protein